MGELIFTICYGGAMIVMGFVTRAFVVKMEREVSQSTDRSTESQQNINI